MVVKAIFMRRAEQGGAGSIFELFSFSKTMPRDGRKTGGDTINMEFEGHKQEFGQQMGVFRNVHYKI